MSATIPYYEIVNRFLLGLLFVFGITVFHVHEILSWLSAETQQVSIPTGLETVVTVCLFAAIYEIGLIINRISSVGIEEFLILIRAWPQRSDYVHFNKAKERYDRLPILAREYDFCKGQVTLFLLLMLFSILHKSWTCFFVYFFFFIVFVVSGWKNSSRINELVKDFEGSSSPQIITKG